jgi:superfamily II DNA helicase RecQ
MGIDQIVKCVLVIGCPSSIEEYYQQIGRGGRDGLQCETIFYYDISKKIIRDIMIKKERNSHIKLDNLKKVEEYFYTKKCRRQYILDYLGLSKSYFAYNGFTCTNCDNCINYNLTDITSYILNNSKKIDSIIYEFKLKKIINDWKEYIQFKKYTTDNLPENMKIRLRLDQNDLSEYDVLYDKFDNIKIKNY